MMLTTNQKLVITIGSILFLFVLGIAIQIANAPELPGPKFENGDMVIHVLNEKEGQVIDNTYKFNKKSNCWKVRLRIKSDVEKTDTLSKKLNKLIDDAPLVFNEFELEKK
jgi:hypothetical protein